MSLEKNLSILTTIPEKALIKLHKHLNLSYLPTPLLII